MGIVQLQCSASWQVEDGARIVESIFCFTIILHGQKSSNCAGECSGCRKLLCFALQYCHASDVVMKAVCKDGEKISDYC